MRTRTVRFQSVNDMLDFVNKIENYSCRVDARSDRYTVNAKCLFGLVNLGLEKDVEIAVYDEDCDGLFEDIEPYIAA